MRAREVDLDAREAERQERSGAPGDGEQEPGGRQAHRGRAALAERAHEGVELRMFEGLAPGQDHVTSAQVPVALEELGEGLQVGHRGPAGPPRELATQGALVDRETQGGPAALPTRLACCRGAHDPPPRSSSSCRAAEASK